MVLFLGVSACSTYDDTSLWHKINEHEERITELEELCRKMNTNISSLQTIVEALEKMDFITDVSPISEGGEVIGYTITFDKSGEITIYHGKDGNDGADGTDGEDGTNGESGSSYMPQIGVKQDTDGIYYWTLDGEWLLDDSGNKVKSVSTDGKDGITPQIKIEEGYWYVSYDEGASWTQLGKATGEDGADSDAFFSSVTMDENGVHFVLVDGTEFTIPLAPKSPLAELDDISFIPKYNDGKATVTQYADGVTIAVFDFMVAPKAVAATIAENYATLLSISAVETATRAVTLVNMPVLSCTADAEGGTITIEASGEYLNPSTFTGTVTYSAAVTISDGDNSIISDYIELHTFTSTENSPEQEPETPADPEEPELPSDDKIIYYTTTDSAPVTLGATTGFGGILLSNEYDTEANQGKLTFSAKVTCIPANAFKSSTISTISIPNTVKEIGNEAFFQSKISEITIPDSVTTMGNDVFYDCNSLVSANIGNSVTSIGQHAFCRCDNLVTIKIPDSVKSIGQFAFEYSDALVTVIIGNGVETIGHCAFRGCGNLTSVTFGTGLKSVESYAFNGCDKLQCLYINDIASFCNIGFADFHGGHLELTSNPLYYNDCNLYLNGNLVENLVIPEGVTHIGQGVFLNCDSLKSVTIPNSVKTISNRAFYDCDNITTIDIPTVNDPNQYTTIGEYAFESCDKLTSVTIGERVSSIGYKAFYCCNVLQKLYCKATLVPTLGSEVFYGDNGYTIGTEIYVPEAVIEDYKAATNWSSYVDYIVGYSF